MSDEEAGKECGKRLWEGESNDQIQSCSVRAVKEGREGERMTDAGIDAADVTVHNFIEGREIVAIYWICRLILFHLSLSFSSNQVRVYTSGRD